MKDECSSCTLYIVLFSIIFVINVGIGKENVPKYNYTYQTTI